MSIYDPIARYYEADVSYHTEDIPFYQEMAQRAGSPILDAMCGSGRVLVPLAAAGNTVTGLDISQPMLDIARERAAADGLLERVTLLQGDLRSAELPANHFMLAFVAVNSFMHLEKIKDQLAALANLRSALVKGGILLIDLFNPTPSQLNDEKNGLQLERTFRLDGRQVFKLVASQSDLATQVCTMTYFFDELDDQGYIKRQVMRFRLRWLYRYELEHLLARAGFMVLSVYGSYELDNYTSDSEQLIVMATPRREDN